MFGCTCVGVWTHHTSTSGIASQHLPTLVVETGPVIGLELLDSVGSRPVSSGDLLPVSAFPGRRWGEGERERGGVTGTGGDTGKSMLPHPIPASA